MLQIFAARRDLQFQGRVTQERFRSSNSVDEAIVELELRLSVSDLFTTMIWRFSLLN